MSITSNVPSATPSYDCGRKFTGFQSTPAGTFITEPNVILDVGACAALCKQLSCLSFGYSDQQKCFIFFVPFAQTNSVDPDPNGSDPKGIAYDIGCWSGNLPSPSASATPRVIRSPAGTPYCGFAIPGLFDSGKRVAEVKGINTPEGCYDYCRIFRCSSFSFAPGSCLFFDVSSDDLQTGSDVAAAVYDAKCFERAVSSSTSTLPATSTQRKMHYPTGTPFCGWSIPGDFNPINPIAERSDINTVRDCYQYCLSITCSSFEVNSRGCTFFEVTTENLKGGNEIALAVYDAACFRCGLSHPGWDVSKEVDMLPGVHTPEACYQYCQGIGCSTFVVYANSCTFFNLPSSELLKGDGVALAIYDVICFSSVSSSTASSTAVLISATPSTTPPPAIAGQP